MRSVLLQSQPVSYNMELKRARCYTALIVAAYSCFMAACT